jgi:hypothetical protein
LAEKLAGVVYSTDRYFETEQGYRFNPAKLAEYHARNLEAFRVGCSVHNSPVVCDNTNSTRVEVDRYRSIALAYGYTVTVITVGEPKDPAHVKTCIARNIHKVPAQTIVRMAERFEV